MTTLAITPNWKNKSAKFKGTVAAGEHVSVTILNDDGEGGEFIEDASTLRLRVVNPCNGRTLAIFPEPEQDEVLPSFEAPEEVDEGAGAESPSIADAWDSDLSPLRCTLNLNTVQMLKAVPPAANVPLLWVLDDYDNKTLYFKEQFLVEHWPRLRGEEEPTDLDNYKDIIADFSTRLTAAEENVANSAQAASAAEAAATAARDAASAAATAATDAQTGAIASKDAAQTAANDAASAKTAAEDAQGKAEDAQEAAETAQGKAKEYAEAAEESAAAFVVDKTLSIEGAAADAKAVGEAKQGLTTQISTVQGNLNAEVTARETLAAAVGDNRQNLANEISRAQTAEQGLRADVTSAQSAISDRYTKSEVDTKIAGVQTFQKYLVQTLPAPEAADYKGLYLVPTGETTPEGDLCEEWTVVGEVGSRRWERIGGTTVDLSDYYTKTETDALLAGKMPSTATGSNIPTSAAPGSPTLSDSISTLNDTKASKADATLTPIYSDTPMFSEWTGTVVDAENIVVTGLPYYQPLDDEHTESYGWYLPTSHQDLQLGVYDKDAVSLSFNAQVDDWYLSYTATRVRTDILGYQLGSQTDKPLASEAEAEALRTEKADKPATFTTGNLAGLDANGNPTDSGVKPSDKLDATSAAPAFSSDSSVSYSVGSHCTYNGKLYKCVAATTGGTWDSSAWTADTMTDPDAVLDITSQNQLRVVAKDGTELWAQGYDLASTSSATLVCDAVNNFTFADGATSQAFTLPTVPSGKVGDFGLDIDNSANASAATMTLTGLDTAFSVVVPEGESLNDMLAIAAGELAQFYVTLTTFRVNNLPTWHILKQVVENGGATA